MRDLRSLEQTLAENLPWHKARIKFVAAFIVALVTVKTVNLVEIACAFAGKAQQDSQYKKLQRFFRFFEIPYADIAQLVVKLLGVDGPWTLTLDRTNWKLGKAELNLLVLGIVHQGIAYPLVWWGLDKAGNSKYRGAHYGAGNLSRPLWQRANRLFGRRPRIRRARLVMLVAARGDQFSFTCPRQLPGCQRARKNGARLQAVPRHARQHAADYS
jgi:hypothetical protein